MCDGGLVVSGRLEQMGADRVGAIVASQPPIGVEGFQQFESGGPAVHHRCGDGVIERHHRIVVGHTLEQPVQGQDLRTTAPRTW